MGATNQGLKTPIIQNDEKNKKNQKRSNKSQQQKSPSNSQPSAIIQSKQQATFSLPQTLQNRQKVRQCINKYNDKIELQMKKPYVQQFMSMRQKLLLNMQSICKQQYSVVGKANSGQQLKDCMQSVQLLISEQDERMQQEFGMKLFLLADKCLMKEELVTDRGKQKSKENEQKGSVGINKCVDKLVKYRNLNMEMHILKLELAKELL